MIDRPSIADIVVHPDSDTYAGYFVMSNRQFRVLALTAKDLA